MSGHRYKRPRGPNGPADLGLVQRAIAEERAVAAQAKEAAIAAGAAVVYLQSLLGVLVFRLGGTVKVEAAELGPFAHPEPVLTEPDAGDASITLTAQPVRDPTCEQTCEQPEDRSRSASDPLRDEVLPPLPAPAAFGLCPGCGHERALLPHTTGKGDRMTVCTECIATT